MLKNSFLIVLRLNILLILGLISNYVYALVSDLQSPIIINADKASLDNNKGEAIYVGNVLIKQGTIQIKADQITVITNNGVLQSFKALGKPAFFKQQVEENNIMITAQSNIINYKNNIIQLLNNAQINYADNIFTGEDISYNLQTKVINSGKYQNNKDNKESSRINIILQPQNNIKNNQ